MIREREVYGAFVLTGEDPEILVSSAASPAVALTGKAQTMSRKANETPARHQAPRNDTFEFLAIMPASISQSVCLYHGGSPPDWFSDFRRTNYGEDIKPSDLPFLRPQYSSFCLPSAPALIVASMANRPGDDVSPLPVDTTALTFIDVKTPRAAADQCLEQSSLAKPPLVFSTMADRPGDHIAPLPLVSGRFRHVDIETPRDAVHIRLQRAFLQPPKLVPFSMAIRPCNHVASAPLHTTVVTHIDIEARSCKCIAGKQRGSESHSAKSFH